MCKIIESRTNRELSIRLSARGEEEVSSVEDVKEREAVVRKKTFYQKDLEKKRKERKQKSKKKKRVCKDKKMIN